MAFEVISGDLIAKYTINSFDEVYLKQGASLLTSNTAFEGLNDDPMYLSIQGEVVSGSSTTIILGNLATDTSELVITIGATGSVSNLKNASAFYLARDGVDFINRGEVSGEFKGIYYASSVANGTVRNTGSIFAIETEAIYAQGNFSANNGTFDVENSGTLSGGFAAITIRYQKLNLFNSGTITGDIAVKMDVSHTDNSMQLINTGTLTGRTGTSIDATAWDDTINNSGRIKGDIQMNGGADIFDGRGGVVEGTVFGGGGNDTYTIDDNSIILSEFSTEGTDTVNSSVGWTLGTNFENLALMGSKAVRGIGNGEDNLIIGNDADNRLRGRAGDDVIFGEGGDDNIRGQIGNDVLYGGYGDDIVKGNRGNDTLSGGAGDDLLKGGGGSDRYVFDFNNDGTDTLKEVGGSNDTLSVTGRVMSQLDFRRSGNDLVIESGGTVDRVVIDDFYIAGDAGRIEILETTTTTKYLQTGLIGAATDDIIVGSSGTQIIRGGAGDDILIGKGDKDRLTGGSGADRFDYDALSDSGTTSTTMDTIYDFVAGTDRIDLFDIDADSTTAGNQNFSFIGAGAYSGTAGELRYQFIGANTRLGVDVDGDMVDDFNILLAGNVAFSAGDFVL